MRPAPEAPFLFGDHSTGKLVLPGQTRAPAALLLHGFASQADEVGGLFVQLADALSDAGIASLRFTFKGFEQPPETRVDSSIPAMIAEALAAADALAAHPAIDPDRIGLLGFSLGGAVAVLAAAREAQRFRSLATWSCAADLEARFRELAGQAVFDRALAGEEVHLDLGWREIRLGPALFASMPGVLPEEAVRDWPGPFLAIAGGEDPLSAYLEIFLQNAGGQVQEGQLLAGADHIFNVLEDPERFAPQVIGRTTDWFRGSLVR